MIDKLLNFCLHSSASRPSVLPGVGHDRMEAFYANLAVGIRNFERSLAIGQDSHNYSLAWLLPAMDFVRALHSSVFSLIEEVWIPMRMQKTVGMDVLETYFVISTRLLEVSNSLRDGLSRLEHYQLCLDHCLASLESSMESIPQTGDAGTSGALKKKLESCKLELEQMESEMPATLKMTADKSRTKEQPWLQRSHSVFPSPFIQKKVFEISQVMADVQVVTTVVSCIVLRVLTGTSEEYSIAYGSNFNTERAKLMADLLRLQEKVEKSELKHGRRVKRLEEIETVQRSVRSLIEEAETGLEQSSKAVGTNRAGHLRAAVEGTRIKLDAIADCSLKLASLNNDLFSEILRCQKNLMNVVDNQILRTATI